jgi:large subunit ribosomal protein L4
MVTVNKLDEKGKQSGSFGLEDAVFGGRISVVTVGDALIRQLANKRKAHANTKDRTEIHGGGRKPWRQKGTGRARAGSIRSPLWKGGAVAMGPRGEANYVKEMPKKQRRVAIRSLLTSKTRKGKVSVMAPVALTAPKTKTIVEILKNMELGTEKVLFVLADRDVNFEKSVRNIPAARAILHSNLNPHDLLNYDRVVLFEGAVQKVTEGLA